MDYEWIIWLLVGLCIIMTVGGGLLCLNDEKEAGMKLLVGWWGGVAMVVITTLTLTFVVKPILAWFFGLF